jgi:hypothetical protein
MDRRVLTARRERDVLTQTLKSKDQLIETYRAQMNIRDFEKEDRDAQVKKKWEL